MHGGQGCHKELLYTEANVRVKDLAEAPVPLVMVVDNKDAGI